MLCTLHEVNESIRHSSGGGVGLGMHTLPGLITRLGDSSRNSVWHSHVKPSGWSMQTACTWKITEIWKHHIFATLRKFEMTTGSYYCLLSEALYKKRLGRTEQSWTPRRHSSTRVGLQILPGLVTRSGDSSRKSFRHRHRYDSGVSTQSAFGEQSCLFSAHSFIPECTVCKWITWNNRSWVLEMTKYSNLCTAIKNLGTWLWFWFYRGHSIEDWITGKWANNITKQLGFMYDDERSNRAISWFHWLV